MAKRINVRRLVANRKVKDESIKTTVNNEMKSLHDLVGYELIDLTDESMIVRKDNMEYVLEIIRDYGDCCGYTEITNRLYRGRGCNPVITKVEYTQDKEVDRENEQSTLKITLFGLDKEIAEVNCLASSGSGWCYGANVTVVCKKLNLDEELVAW